MTNPLTDADLGHIQEICDRFRTKDGISTDVESLAEPILVDIITTVLKMFHRDPLFHEQDTWPLGWRNGWTPYERVLDAICKEFGIAFDIEWKPDGPDGRVKSVKIRRGDEVAS